MLSLAACVFLAFFGTVYGGAKWEYTGSHGPDQWHTKYPDCGGRMQSPINIDSADVLYDPSLESFDLRQYTTCTDCAMVLENVGGHTAEVTYSGKKIIVGGGSLPDQYILDQFHFHWGKTNDVGSEHLLNNKAAPLEMHIVHHIKSLNKTGSAQHPYGLAVLGFFFKIGSHNDNFNNLLSHFKNITHKDQEVELEPFALLDLLPKNTLEYYRYYGSLTTPPCYETVVWTLFTERIEISQQQVDVFRTLKTKRDGESTEVVISNDFRPVQELHERRVITNDKSTVNTLISQLKEEIRMLQTRCVSNDARTLTSTFGVTSCLVVLLLLLTIGMN